MYSTVYVDEVAKKEENKVEKLLGALYERFSEDPDRLPEGYLEIAYTEGVDRAVTDYISGMSDEFATLKAAYTSKDHIVCFFFKTCLPSTQV